MAKRPDIIGENNLQVKLTDEIVLDIRAEYATGDTSYRKLALKHGVSRTTIASIITRKKWTHI